MPTLYSIAILLASMAGSAFPSLTIQAVPPVTVISVGQNQASVSIRVTVPRDARNRVVCVAVEGPIVRSSCWEHDATGPYRTEFRYPGLAVGMYEVVGEVQWVDEANGKRKVTIARTAFEIRE